MDFDGTIAEFAWPKCGPPRENVIEALRRLRGEGWRIIIHTSRANTDGLLAERQRRIGEMIAFLGEHEVPVNEVWGLSLYGMEWGADFFARGKPIAHFYLDDRGLLDIDTLTADHIVLIALRRFVEVEAQYAKSLAENRAADV